MVKKTCRGTINLLKNQLEAAEQEISKLVSSTCVIRPVFCRWMDRFLRYVSCLMFIDNQL